jgi:hypothetical protein
MKAIDLHIHTIHTILDFDFTFDISKLEEYVSSESLKCIAITNHNMFDKSNYELIKNKLNIIVLPGIEVSLEKGHILVIGNIIDADRLEKQSSLMRQYIIDEHSYLTYEQFLEIFNNYKDYLLIPHYAKKPYIPLDVINKFGKEIIVGEVSSAKKWFSLKKKTDKLIPVLFSDIRIRSELKNYPGTHLYIDCDDFTIGGLKNSLRDRNKISLSNTLVDEEFQINPEGTMASLGLNILIGKRSTGKTYLLDKLSKSFSTDSVKYIKQFSIVNDASESAFKNRLDQDNAEYSEKYLKELKDIVDIAFNIDIAGETTLLENYLESLIDFASKQDKMDAFSKCTLFNATSFEIEEDEELKNNIVAIDTLLSSKKYLNIILKYLSKNQLIKLLYELVETNKAKDLNNYNLEYINQILKLIQSELEENSALNKIKDFNVVRYAYCKYFIRKFDIYLEKIKKEKEISKNDFYKFKVRATRKPYTSVQEIKNKIKNCPGISNEFKYYSEPYKYINALSNVGIPKNQIYKAIVDVEYVALNNNGSEISGGERAEYLLYNQIKSGENYDLILIDEPESSFDNVYLNKNIRSLINNISQKTTTFIVTHNHILGVMLNADKILYTCIENGEYKVYTGKISSKKFKCYDGTEKSTDDIIMETMEAGKESYDERKKIYENIEN